MPDSHYKWKPSPHTADLAIEIESTDHAGLFHAAFEGLLGLLEISSKVDEGVEIIEHRLEQKFCAIEEGLVDFLNECIYLMDGEDLVPFKVHALEVTAGDLDATFHCRAVVEEERSRISHIKAATYSDLEVVLEGGIYRAKIILDT